MLFEGDPIYFCLQRLFFICCITDKIYILFRKSVKEVNAELTTHMVKEEKVLFPYIKALVAAQTSAQPLEATHFGTVQNPINMMEMEHEMVGKAMEEIRELTQNYLLPADGCASYSLLYKMLDEFEDDLHLHIHLENNILFPKALEMEKQMEK